MKQEHKDQVIGGMLVAAGALTVVGAVKGVKAVGRMIGNKISEKKQKKQQPVVVQQAASTTVNQVPEEVKPETTAETKTEP